jgi:hypothetical protein
MFSKTKTKDNQSLRDPNALTDFYMDTFMCSEYQLKNADCMDEYTESRMFSFNKRKKFKECMNYLDQYKACIIGINQNRVTKR